MALTKTQTREMAAELLELRPAVERYQELEQAIKRSMKRLKMDKIEMDQGRVFISVSEKMTLEPAAARTVLGPDLAQKVIKTTEKVSNALLKALAEMGDISDEQLAELREKAKKSEVVSLYVRPLK